MLKHLIAFVKITPSMEAVLMANIDSWKKSQNVNNQAVERQNSFKNEQKKSNL